MDLSINSFPSLPSHIGNITSLIELDLYEFDFLGFRSEYLPKEIGNLSSLKILRLNSNKLKELPKEIGNLVNLEVINLSNNKLITLPKEISNLKKLESLTISNNKLENLPEDIIKLDQLSYIDLYENNDLYLSYSQKLWLYEFYKSGSERGCFNFIRDFIYPTNKIEQPINQIDIDEDEIPF